MVTVKETKLVADEVIPVNAVRQDEEGVLLVAAMPSVDKESLQVTVEEGILSIEAPRVSGKMEGYKLISQGIAPVVYKASFFIPVG